MFKISLKKTLFDMWDNLYFIFLLNIGYLAIFALAFFLDYCLVNLSELLSNFNTAKPTIISLLFIRILSPVWLLFCFTGASCEFLRDVVDYKNPRPNDWLQYLIKTYRLSLTAGMIHALFIYISIIALSFYINMKTLQGLTVFFIIIWITVIWCTGFQFYFPLQSRFNKGLNQNFKRMLLFGFDSPGFTFFQVIPVSIIIMLISLFSFFSMIGFGTLLLWYTVIVKLRCLKYEAVHQVNTNEMGETPTWADLLKKENEKIGNRTIKGLIFPWTQ